MRKLLLTTAFLTAIALPQVTFAQERVVDGALGALSGAVVAGPVGLVVGGVVGVTAGPSIASGWGLRSHRHRYRRVRYIHRAPR